MLILPGGGFSYVVPNLEGSEAAEWLNSIGVSAFVLRYRTKEAAEANEPLWKRPLEDTQRAMRLIRSQAEKLKIRTDRLGVLGFSAGGQVAAIAHAKGNNAVYSSMDAVDQLPCRADFSILVYPWQVLDKSTNELLEPIKMDTTSSPAFIVHTSDDGSTAAGAAKLYIALKEKNVSAELHIYQNGGHGYGTRERPISVISTARASHRVAKHSRPVETLIFALFVAGQGGSSRCQPPVSFQTSKQSTESRPPALIRY